MFEKNLFTGVCGGSMINGHTLLCYVCLVYKKIVKGLKNIFQRENNSMEPGKWSWIPEICICYMIPDLCLYFACRTDFKTKVSLR